MAKKTKTKKIKTKIIKRSLFYYGVLLIPILQFCVFYLYVNFDSFYMAFTRYDYDQGRFVFAGFDVFKGIFYKFQTINYFWESTLRSILLTVIRIVVGIPIPLVFSYFLYKKFMGHKFFKVMLFLPTMLSAIVLVTIFKYFVEYGMPEFLGTPSDLLSNPQTAFPVVLVYYLWMGLGSQLILYTGAMSTISQSVIEAAEIDGAPRFREFFHIVLPSVWPTIVTFIVIRFATTFTEMMSLYDFYGGGASENIMTIGYYLYQMINNPKTATYSNYPELSGLGLMFTIATFPVVICVKMLCEKLGPSED